MAGEDPEDIILPLLEGAIAYLCLPRKSPPGGPSVIGMRVFDSGVSASGTKAKITSLRAAYAAAVVAKAKNSPKTNAAAKATKRTGMQPRALTASGDEVIAIPSSPSPSPPRHRSASPPANAASPGGRKLERTASAATAKAAKSAATNSSAELLLPWDADSLASLLGAHQALAATLLRFERDLKLAAAGSATTQNRRASMSNTRTDAESAGAAGYDGVNEYCDGTDDEHNRPQLEKSSELLERADASLAAALAAAGVGVLTETLPPYADPYAAGASPEAGGMGSKNSGVSTTPTCDGDPLTPTRPPSPPSRLSTPLNVASDNGGGSKDIAVEHGSPMFSTNRILPVVPLTVVTTDAAANHKVTDLEGHQPFPEPQGEEGTASSPPSGGGEGGESWWPGHSKGVLEPWQRGHRDGDKTTGGVDSMWATTTAAGAGPKTVSEIHSMRCTAKEGLGRFEDAFKDCRAAIAAVPGAPKLWAKAASLALQLGSEAERREREIGTVASTKALSDGWAREVSLQRISGLQRTGLQGNRKT